MTRLYEPAFYYTAKNEAQHHLTGRTHYVDDDTLKFHHSKVLDCGPTDNGLLCWIITSDAIDMNNTRRGFRYVVFDIFGNVVSRVDLENAFKTSKKAKAALFDFLKSFDAKAATLEALARKKKNDEMDESELIKTLSSL